MKRRVEPEHNQHANKKFYGDYFTYHFKSSVSLCGRELERERVRVIEKAFCPGYLAVVTERQYPVLLSRVEEEALYIKVNGVLLKARPFIRADEHCTLHLRVTQQHYLTGREGGDGEGGTGGMGEWEREGGSERQRGREGGEREEEWERGREKGRYSERDNKHQ